jgi:hypothetical protein
MIKRTHVPLRMRPENVQALLDNIIPCLGVSFKRDSNTDNGVILMFHWVEGQREKAIELGFRPVPPEEDSE